MDPKILHDVIINSSAVFKILHDVIINSSAVSNDHMFLLF